jgi:hypothetical protein
MTQALTNATTATTNSTIELILRQFPRRSCRCTNVGPSNWFHAGRSRRLQHKKKSPAPTASIGAIGHGTAPQLEPTGPANLVGTRLALRPARTRERASVDLRLLPGGRSLAAMARSRALPDRLRVLCRKLGRRWSVRSAVLQESSTGALQKKNRGGASQDNVDER